MDRETRSAILRACRIIKDDKRVLSTCCAPHERVTVEDVAKIRATLVHRNDLFASRTIRRFDPAGEPDTSDLAEVGKQKRDIARSSKIMAERLAAHYG